MIMNPSLLDTPIWQLTPRELFKLQEEWKKQTQTEPQPTDVAPEKEWVTIEVASEALGRSKGTIYRYINEGKMHSKVIGCVTFVNILKPKETQYKRTKRQFRNT